MITDAAYDVLNHAGRYWHLSATPSKSQSRGPPGKSGDSDSSASAQVHFSSAPPLKYEAQTPDKQYSRRTA